MSREDVLTDIAYARSLAEEGRDAPLLGGAYLVFWGLLNVPAWCVQWALLADVLPREPGNFGLLWGIYALVGLVGMIWLTQRTRGKPNRAANNVRAESAIWFGACLAMAALSAGAILRMWVDQDVTAPNIIMGVGFALYGAALLGTAQLSRHHWMTGFAVTSFVVALALSVYANTPEAYLIAAAGSLLVWVIPGFVLLRREPPATA